MGISFPNVLEDGKIPTKEGKASLLKKNILLKYIYKEKKIKT